MKNVREAFLPLKFSNYLMRILNEEEHYKWLISENNILKKFSIIELYKDAKNLFKEIKNLNHVYKKLRSFKQRHFFRIAFADFVKGERFNDIVSQISDLASVSIQAVIDILWERPELWLDENKAVLWKDIRENFKILVIGFGKLGGHELNYVSDVDIAYFYDSKNSLYKNLINLLFQNLTRIISEIKFGDRVFEIDLRLRPAGKESEIASSVDFALEYYLNLGQIWDRIALLKADFIAGDRLLSGRFFQEIKPFVFRRFLDFQSLEEVKKIRNEIIFQSKKRTFKNKIDLKLGIGGIREIEFFVQTFQLIYGGRYPALQKKNTLEVLDSLHNLGFVPKDDYETLKESYILLRRLEHCVQLENNTHTSTVLFNEEKFERYATALHFKSGKELFEKVKDLMNRTNKIFKALFLQEESKSSVFVSNQDKLGFADLFKKLSTSAQQVIKDSLESLIEKIENREDLIQHGISKVKKFLTAINSRPGIRKLINFAYDWLELLIRSIFLSDFVSSLLSAQPSLVEVLNDKELTSLTPSIWKKRSISLVEGFEPDEKIERIRKLKNERMLFLSLMDINGALKLKEILLNLSELADFVIEQTFLTLCDKLGFSPELPLAIFGLGKLGSKEMGYFSDLDLMFVWDPEDKNSDIIPEKVVKLVQRLLRMLSINLQEGPGYEVDTKIRPSGNYGPLIVTRRNWEDYYFSQADIWEIQSLLRFRFVCGKNKTGEFLEKKAEELCFAQKDEKKVWSRIDYLRKRIEKERANENGKDKVDIKLGYGGLVDLEFFIQGTQLTRGHLYENLRNRDPWRLLDETLKVWNIPLETRSFLQRTFYEYKSLLLRFQLFSGLNLSSIRKHQFEDMIRLTLWPTEDKVLIENWENLLNVRKKVRRFYEHITDEKRGN